MPVSDFTVKLSGNVAYDDNTSQSFESSATWRGHLGNAIATHNATESVEAYGRLYNNQSASVNMTLALLPGTNTTTPATPTLPKNVSSFVLELSGNVAYDDNTEGAFVVQWVNGAVDVFPSATDTNYLEILEDASARAFLVQVLEAVVGTGNVTLSA